jgi:glycerol-3-phosphate cytidylyltransferase
MKKINRLNILKNDTRFTSETDILKYIKINNIKFIYIFNPEFLKYSYAIRNNYPNIQMDFFAYDKNDKVITSINYINKLNVNDDEIYKFYNDPNVIYINKPIIRIIKLITFGTFDLFHFGHENIFKKCADYSNHITVGLSTDEFTFKKKQIYPNESYEIRKQNIFEQKNIVCVFPEKSMELKGKYINSHESNIFIMGSDWEGKFDWLDYCVIYFERTQGISSTMLREFKKI